jgi:TetR/AcrR family transcriptional repressor of lmrAB and yxaGH operons
VAYGRVAKEEVLWSSLELFRADRFDGVSLSQISPAAGLEKASLYYRIPGGKEEIVLAALDQVTEFFVQNVLGPLSGSGDPHERAAIAAEGLRTFYSDGSKSCVTDVLSLPLAGTRISQKLNHIMRVWIGAFSEVAREIGFSQEEARPRAEGTIVSIEGSLDISQVLGDIAAFGRSLAGPRNLLTKHGRHETQMEPAGMRRSPRKT